MKGGEGPFFVYFVFRSFKHPPEVKKVAPAEAAHFVFDEKPKPPAEKHLNII